MGVSLLQDANPDYEYNWIPEEGLTFINGERSNPIANPETSTTYQLVVSYGGCLADTMEFYVEKVDEIQLNVAVDSMNCEGTYILSVSGAGPDAVWRIKPILKHGDHP